MVYKGKDMKTKLPKVAEVSDLFCTFQLRFQNLDLFPGLGSKSFVSISLSADLFLISLPLDPSHLLPINGSYFLLRSNIWNHSPTWALFSFPIIVIAIVFNTYHILRHLNRHFIFITLICSTTLQGKLYYMTLHFTYEKTQAYGHKLLIQDLSARKVIGQ